MALIKCRSCSHVCCLCRLSHKVLKDATSADLALALYCINPASVFMSSIYSESLFSALAFGGMLSLHAGSPCHAAVCFGVASTCRSNGATTSAGIQCQSILPRTEAGRVQNCCDCFSAAVCPKDLAWATTCKLAPSSS